MQPGPIIAWSCRCGTRNDVEARFCSQCGKFVEDGASAYHRGPAVAAETLDPVEDGPPLLPPQVAAGAAPPQPAAASKRPVATAPGPRPKPDPPAPASPAPVATALPTAPVISTPAPVAARAGEPYSATEHVVVFVWLIIGLVVFVPIFGMNLRAFVEALLRNEMEALPYPAFFSLASGCAVAVLTLQCRKWFAEVPILPHAVRARRRGYFAIAGSLVLLALLTHAVAVPVLTQPRTPAGSRSQAGRPPLQINVNVPPNQQQPQDTPITRRPVTRQPAPYRPTVGDFQSGMRAAERSLPSQRQPIQQLPSQVQPAPQPVPGAGSDAAAIPPSTMLPREYHPVAPPPSAEELARARARENRYAENRRRSFERAAQERANRSPSTEYRPRGTEIIREVPGR